MTTVNTLLKILHRCFKFRLINEASRQVNNALGTVLRVLLRFLLIVITQSLVATFIDVDGLIGLLIIPQSQS